MCSIIYVIKRNCKFSAKSHIKNRKICYECMYPCWDYSCDTWFVYRKDIAKLLGYENYAQMSMETKMAGSVENVMNMIERSVVLFVSLYSTVHSVLLNSQSTLGTVL